MWRPPQSDKVGTNIVQYAPFTDQTPWVGVREGYLMLILVVEKSDSMKQTPNDVSCQSKKNWKVVTFLIQLNWWKVRSWKEENTIDTSV